VQIKKMQLGGNAKAREFFETGEGYGGKNMPIADKVRPAHLPEILLVSC
jgi:hypothetical protein